MTRSRSMGMISWIPQPVLNTDVIVVEVEEEVHEENLQIMMTEEEAWIESLLVLTTDTPQIRVTILQIMSKGCTTADVTV